MKKKRASHKYNITFFSSPILGARKYIECSAVTCEGVFEMFEEAVRLVPDFSPTYPSGRPKPVCVLLWADKKSGHPERTFHRAREEISKTTKKGSISYLIPYEVWPPYPLFPMWNFCLKHFRWWRNHWRQIWYYMLRQWMILGPWSYKFRVT